MPELMRLSEAAYVTGISARTLTRYSETGAFVPVRMIGKRRYVNRAELAAWLAHREVRAAS